MLRDTTISPPKQLFGVRHTQYLLLFILIVIALGMRIALSVAIVAMTTKDASPNPSIPVFDWDDQSVVLSSFFWGYVVMQISAGQLGEKYGPKYFLAAAMTLCSLFSCLIPTMSVAFGSRGAMACRVGQGLTQGFVLPSVHVLLSKWVPTCDRSTVGPLVYTGIAVGEFVGYPISGWISASWAGWPAVFYFYGAVGFVWVAVYLVFGANNPLEHRSITDEESEYIVGSLNQEKGFGRKRTPWKNIFTSLPFLAIFVAHCGVNWSFWTLATETPTYIAKVLKFDIKYNGLLSATPYFAHWLCGLFAGWASNYIISKGASIAFSRKLLHSIGVLIPALALIYLGFIEEQQRPLAVAILIIAVGINGFVVAGYTINHIDISPNYAGTLMGITNGVGAFFSIMGPLLVQFIVTEDDNLGQWRIVFCVGAAVYVVTDLVFCVFGKGEVQWWDRDGEEGVGDAEGQENW